MQNSGTPKTDLWLKGVKLKEVDSYVGLGQEVNVRLYIQLEFARRRLLGGANFIASPMSPKRREQITVPVFSMPPC